MENAGKNVRVVADEMVNIRKDMVRAARVLVGNRFDAEDVVHASCLRALERGAKLKTQDNVRGWLHTIMRHAVVDHWRRERRTVPLEMVAEPIATEPEAPMAWTKFEPDDVLAALERCSPHLRRVYDLQVLQGLSGAETARRLGIPLATVSTRLFRARARLRQLLTAAAETKMARS